MTLSLSKLKATPWSRVASTRVWRWNWSKWTYCGRGCKWQNSRSWGWVAPWFEWGQTPLFRRMPKLKGFSNALFKKEFNIINISDINTLLEKWITDIDKSVLLENRIIRKKTLWVKLLWNWELNWKVNVKLDLISKSAKEKLEKAWANIEIL